MSPDPAASDDPDRNDPDRDLDVDARFAEIVAGWEPTPTEPADEPGGELRDEPRDEPQDEPGRTAPEEPVGEDPRVPPDPPPDERLRGLFQPSWNDPLDDEASWDDEGHFVPPPPPPLPDVEPRRRLAWAALLGAPLVTVLLVGAGIRVAGWMAFVLAVAFVGGFGYLVATMRSGPPDDWSGDDGARI